jgi:endonuclease YncB( thermonuclease family)
MSRLKRLLDTVLAYALLGLALAAAAMLMQREAEPLPGPITVVDGDTLVIGGERTRLAGIDAPELGQSCEAAAGPVPCGWLARQALVGMIGGDVECRSRRRDRYGRRLVSCRDGEGDLAARLVLAGQAIAYGCCRDEEREARQAGRGVWATRFEPPEDWRKRHARPRPPSGGS